MKKVFICFFVFMITILSTCAGSMPDIGYKNIKNKEKISYNQEIGSWDKKLKQKEKSEIYTKVKGFGTFYDYLDYNKNFAFSTNCEYEFIYQGRLIGYSNRDMKFYDFNYINGAMEKSELTPEEVKEMLPEYTIITFSDFSPKTNSFKLKKVHTSLKLLLLNNTDKTFDEYTFTSGNAKFERFDLRGFLKVTKSGMIQFSDSKENSENPWYIILVR